MMQMLITENANTFNRISNILFTVKGSVGGGSLFDVIMKADQNDQ